MARFQPYIILDVHYFLSKFSTVFRTKFTHKQYTMGYLHIWNDEFSVQWFNFPAASDGADLRLRLFRSEITIVPNWNIFILYTERSIYYRKYILQITQPSQNRFTLLQYRFAVISEAPSILKHRLIYNVCCCNPRDFRPAGSGFGMFLADLVSDLTL